MRRSEFLRRLIVGVAAATVAPSLLTDDVEIDQTILDLINKPIPKIGNRYYTFKVSQELLQDKDAFEEVLQDVIDDNNMPFGSPSRIELGYEDDDFVKWLYTIKLTYSNQ